MIPMRGAGRDYQLAANPYAGCYVEAVRGRWRVSYPDGTPVSHGRYRQRSQALDELRDLARYADAVATRPTPAADSQEGTE